MRIDERDVTNTHDMEPGAAAEQPRPEQQQAAEQAAEMTADEALFKARGIIDNMEHGRTVPGFDAAWLLDAMLAVNDQMLEDLAAAETEDCLAGGEGGTPATDRARRKARDEFDVILEAARACVLHDMAPAPSRDAKLAIAALGAMDEPPEPIVRAVHSCYCRDNDQAHRLMVDALDGKQRDAMLTTYRNRKRDQLDAIHAMRCAVAGALSSDAWAELMDPEDAFELIGAAIGMYCSRLVDEEDEQAVALLAARWAVCDALEALDAAAE